MQRNTVRFLSMEWRKALKTWKFQRGTGFFTKIMTLNTHKKSVKLRIQTEMSGPKLCKVLASTCRLRHSLDGCLEFRRSGQSRRVWSQTEKKLKVDESELREVGC